MKTPRIVVVGSSNTDLVVSSPRIPAPGETIIGGEFSVAPGGKGANQAVAAARLGGDVSFVGCIGRDEFGDAAIAGLRADGIEIGNVRRVDGAHAGVALIVVADDGENAIVVAPGSNSLLTGEDIDAASEAIRNADVQVMQLEVPLDAVWRALEIAHEAGVTTLLNPAPAQELDRGLLQHVDWITPNETEAAQLAGLDIASEGGRLDAADALRRLGVKNVVITCGSDGALYFAEGRSVNVVAIPVDPIDTVGAGDVFSGALAVALGECRDVTEALRFANAAAAISVTRRGAQPSAPSRLEVESFLAERR